MDARAFAAVSESIAQLLLLKEVLCSIRAAGTHHRLLVRRPTAQKHPTRGHQV